MPQTPQVVIIHGSYGSPAENWFPWLRAELDARGIAAKVPAFPTPEGQAWHSWRRVFHDVCGEPSPGMVLIGHSVGCGMILRLLEECRSPVRGVALAAGWVGLLNDPEFDPLIESFCAGAFDWKAIVKNAGTVKMFHGDDDPYVPLGRGRELAWKLGAELQIIPGGGHLNAEKGFLMFPELLLEVLSLAAPPSSCPLPATSGSRGAG